MLRKRFSLIELLVIVAILAILMSLLSPALRHSLAVTRTIGCANNLKTMHLIAMNYEEDYNGRLAASYAGKEPFYDFVTKENGGIYPGNSTFMTFMQGYYKGLPIDTWAGGIGAWSNPPDPIFDCPAGTGEGEKWGKTLDEIRSTDKRWVNYCNLRSVWRYINNRHIRYPDPNGVEYSAYGTFMGLPMTDINYASETILIADSLYAAFSGMNKMSSSGVLEYTEMHQLGWPSAPGGGQPGVRVEHEGAYQFVHFDGSVGLLNFPEVHDSFSITWLKAH